MKTDLRVFMDNHDLTNRDITVMLGVNPRTVRRWLSPKESSEIGKFRLEYLKGIIEMRENAKMQRRLDEEGMKLLLSV